LEAQANGLTNLAKLSLREDRSIEGLLLDH